MALVKCKGCGKAISEKAAQCPECGEPAKKKTSLFTWFITILIVLSAIGFFLGDSTKSNDVTAKRAPSPKEVALENVKLEFSWSKAAFGNVMESNFTVTNNSQYQIKDFEVTCTHYSKSDTRIDSNVRIIYDVVPANTTKSFEKFNMGLIHTQVEKTNCAITDLKI